MEDVDQLLKSVASGDVTDEELEESPHIDNSQKLTREKAAERLRTEIEANPESQLVSVGNYDLLGRAIFGAVAARDEKIDKLTREYGIPVVLEIPEGANPPVPEMEEVYHDINQDQVGGQLVLKNDRYIQEHREALQESGFDFVDGWQEEGSDYRWLVTIGQEIGLIYEMRDEAGSWTYREKEH